MRIFAFHLFNDYSGSPKVLMQLAKGWQIEGHEVHLITGTGGKGFLTNLQGIHYHFFWYRFAPNPLVRLFNLMLSQLLLILLLFFRVKKTDIIYVNTVLPFGAALLGKFKGCKVIYHIHETTVRPEIFKKFLFGVVRLTAKEVVYVSRYLAEIEGMSGVSANVLYNAIEESFLLEASKKRNHKNNRCNVLMACSLKAYKGIDEFVELACTNPLFQFRLVLNASNESIASYFSGVDLPKNIALYSTQTNLHPFYQWADVILNLSRPDGWIETFGLTIIEGMAYGLPAIVPPVGGIEEIVDQGYTGFKVDSRDSRSLHLALNTLLNNPGLYAEMKANSLRKITAFSERGFLDQSLRILYRV
ncbi:hypothetical protein GCM10009122_08930 [Fulvivirga kasyanovii]|uniref:Glycosyltransferase n=1 Tax=Fulvivirga kasyanovii TaxID=396812 RepID=A0ABW9S0N5_9BACT|nr:glycosyltransferase family 4 protein [Fulvivirga kasyanovii]MTI29100.1 glycosyltransferase [Fulvivirga kasyanovii]